MRVGDGNSTAAGLLAGGGGPAASPTPGASSAYWTFYEQVAAAQLADWAATASGRVLDLSGRPRFAEQLAWLGHEVVHVGGDLRPRERVSVVRADPTSLGWLQDDSVDAVLAESQLLSKCLAAEVTAEGLLRVLRPGGRLLLVVESLLLGLARLADQGRWAELADMPSADVVLVPDEDGAITRCFWPEELRTLLSDVGFEVEWVRPRSVLSVAAIERALADGGDAALRGLVHTELALAVAREGQATGMHLVASARRPA
jgi:SAM-dependent methyltransferase